MGPSIGANPGPRTSAILWRQLGYLTATGDHRQDEAGVRLEAPRPSGLTEIGLMQPSQRLSRAKALREVRAVMRRDERQSRGPLPSRLSVRDSEALRRSQIVRVMLLEIALPPLPYRARPRPHDSRTSAGRLSGRG